MARTPINTAPEIVSDNNPYGQIGDTIVVSPTLILDVRYGFSRIDAAVLQGNTSGWDSRTLRSIRYAPESSGSTSTYWVPPPSFPSQTAATPRTIPTSNFTA